MFFRFPVGFDKQKELAPGSIDEVLVLDGAAELEHMPESKEVARGCSLVVRGWGFDPLAMAPAGQIVLTMDDRFAVEATYGLPRDDIAHHFQTRELTPTGFKAMMSTGGCAFAPHTIRLYVLSKDGKTYFETAGGYSFEIVQARRQIPYVGAADSGAIHVGVDDIGTMDGAAKWDQGCPRIARGAILVVRGWAFDVERKMPCKRVFVSLGDECVRAIYGIPREDVVQDQNVPSARFSGFTARLNTSSLAPGLHSLGLVGIASDGKTLSESTHPAQIEIVEVAGVR
jgi:hypothetical protein